ncbi:MAG: redox-regulated ATPase YchF, partial [Phaeodactylibacter sp.]|nr:redox-regulated ATPase YchF [Phaeodactylibacter sp.]
FLANIREVDAIVHVVRCFEDPNVVHVDGEVDPVRDREVIDMELLFKDLETVEKRLERLRKQAKSAKKEDQKAVAVTEHIKEKLEQGVPARLLELDEDEKALVKDMFLLTAKPVLYVLNVDEDSVHDGNQFTQAFSQAVAGENAEIIWISAGIEAEIAQLDTREEREEFLEAMGLEEPGVNKLIHASYHLLDLITYFTAGEKEVRAWTIRRGWKAPAAAGVIHTDFEKGFIRAEVIKFDDYVKYGSENAVKEAGKMGVEGKEYVVQDGDVMHFRFNV